MEGWMTQWEEPSAQTGHTGTLVEELLVYPSPAVTQLREMMEAGRCG